MTNEAQVEAWDGRLGDHWVAESDRYARMQEPFVEPLLGAARPVEGEHVLDVGCGAGELTFAVARRVAPTGQVLGVDVSGAMLDHARRRAPDRGVENASFAQADAQVHAFATGAFDLVTSRFGVMFFDDPAAAFTNLARALRPGGRIAFSCWQDLFSNDWVAVPVLAALEHVPVPDLSSLAGPGPFALADQDLIRGTLEAAGCTEVEIRECERPMYQGSSVDDVVDFMHEHEFAEILLAGVEPGVAARAWRAVADALEPFAGDGGVHLTGRAWIVSARRP